MSYLYPGTASSLTLLTKPRTSSALVGKAYMSAGQAVACLYSSPLQGGMVYTSLPMPPWCPQEAVLPTTPPSVPGSAAVSSERISQCPPQDVVSLRSSHPLRRFMEQSGRLFPAISLQGTEVAALKHERLVPLVNHLAEWRPLPNLSQ